MTPEIRITSEQDGTLVGCVETEEFDWNACTPEDYAYLWLAPGSPRWITVPLRQDEIQKLHRNGKRIQDVHPIFFKETRIARMVEAIRELGHKEAYRLHNNDGKPLSEKLKGWEKYIEGKGEKPVT